MLSNPGTITLLRTPAGWAAKFSGEVAGIVVGLFGTDTLPTVFGSKIKPADVEKEMRKQWPKCHVTFQGQEGRQ